MKNLKAYLKLDIYILFIVMIFSFLDISSIYSNASFYGHLLGEQNALSILKGSQSLYFIALNYVLFCLFLTMLFSFIIRSMTSQKSERKIFSFLLFFYVLMYLFIKNPQLFKPFFHLDRLLSVIPSFLGPTVVVFTACLLLFFCFKLCVKNSSLRRNKIGFILLLLWLIERTFILYDFKIPNYFTYQKINNTKAIIVISLDSLNSEALDQIRTLANPSLLKYINSATNYKNIISDSTQTHGSFSSLFSGKQLSELQMKYPLSEMFSTDKQSQLETLVKLKNEKYKISMLRDEFDTSRVETGPAIDNLDFTFKNYPQSSSLTRLLYSINAFGLSPRFLAEKLFPWIFNNALQGFGYRGLSQAEGASEYIYKKLKDDISDQGQFIFIHSCILHQPVKLPYPYYPSRPGPEDGGEAFSYNDLTNVLSAEYRFQYLKQRTSFDDTIYKSGIKYLTEKYLNPLFEDLDQMGLLSTAKIIVMADHGETTWADRKYLPQRPLFVFHGDTDLFGSKSQRPLFLSNTEGPELNKTAGVDENFLNLSQVFKKSLGFEFNHEVYSENAFGLAPEPDDLFSSYSYKEIVKYLNFKGHYIYIDNRFEKPTTLFKQKTIFDSKYKLTLYRTSHGRQLVLCDFLNDHECAQNLWNDPKYRQQKWIISLNKALNNDVANGTDIQVPFSRDLEIDQAQDVKAHLESTNIWLNMYGGFVSANERQSFQPINDVWQKIKTAQEASLEKTIFINLYKKYCLSNQNNFIPDQILSCSGANNEQIFQGLDDLNQLPKLIYSYDVNLIIEQSGAAQTLTTLSQAIKSLPQGQREKTIQDIELRIKDTFHYAFELKFKNAEANYWRLRYIIAQISQTTNVVYEEFVNRSLIQKQDAKIENYFFEKIVSEKISLSKSACLNIHNSLMQNPVGQNSTDRNHLKRLSQSSCL